METFLTKGRRLVASRLLASGLIVVALSSSIVAEEPSETERLMSVLREAATAEEVNFGALKITLDEFGSESLPVLFAVMDTRIIPADDSVLFLSDGILNSIWSSFAHFTASDIRLFLSRFSDAKYSERTRINAIKLIGGMGSSQDLPLIGRLAAPQDAVPSDSVLTPFGFAVAKIFERDSIAAQTAQSLYTELHASLRPTLLDRVGHAQTPERLAILAGLLNLAPESDSHVLRTIREIASSGRGTSDEYVCGNVRVFLDNTNPLLVQVAAQTAGALRDEGAIESLIELMEEHDPQKSSVALESLINICRHNFGSEPARWRNWYNQEKRWWRSEASHVFDDLRHEEPGKVAAAIQAVSMRSLYREELATALLSVLERDEPSLRLLACHTLGDLGAEGARGSLQRLLADPDPAVQAAAKAAVSKLTFRVLPIR